MKALIAFAKLTIAALAVAVIIVLVAYSCVGPVVGV